jgi:DNA-binding NarL/FixJ family response regulator
MRDWLEIEFPQCRVIEAASGEEAITLARIESPRLVVMDIRLPGMNGIETTRQIKAALPLAQIVMLTIHTGDIYRADARAAGASAYVTKPRMHRELVPTLAALLGGCSA